MLGSKAIVSWVALSLLVSNVVALDVTELFNLPASGNAYGDCSSHQARLTNYASDFSTLATQMNNAVQWAQQAEQTQQTIVARELFTAWFGIKFDGNGVLLWESQVAWNVVTDPATTVQEVYGDWATQIGGAQVPYWVPSLNEYYLISPTTFTAGAMCSDTSGLEGMNSFGNSADLKSLKRPDGLNYPVYRKALSDFVLICPNMLEDNTVSDTSAGNTLLSDIGVLPVTADLIDRAQLSFIKPRSTVMLHEILHMVNRWDLSGNGLINGQNQIVDHSCEYHLMNIPRSLAFDLVYNEC
ncbi:hypothetical protein AtubIFM57258_008477 [Aspergillus tubingensis]|nr:hypothetical protein AtubIFM57258_008477 [Aspergillus tubingensis]